MPGLPAQDLEIPIKTMPNVGFSAAAGLQFPAGVKECS
jgi:hypothetical protein